MDIGARGSDTLPLGLINLTSPSFSGTRQSRTIRTAVTKKGKTARTRSAKGRARRGRGRGRVKRKGRKKSRRTGRRKRATRGKKTRGRRKRRARRGKVAKAAVIRFRKSFLTYIPVTGRKKKIQFLRLIRKVPRAQLLRYIRLA